MRWFGASLVAGALAAWPGWTGATAPEVSLQELSLEQWEKEFEEWLDAAPNIPALSDDALSRETMYTREDECL